MAAGAGCIGEGEAYTSLGTSAWIAVSSGKPILNKDQRPYVFTHCIPGKYVSATAIFSAGNSFQSVSYTHLSRSSMWAAAMAVIPTIAFIGVRIS